MPADDQQRRELIEARNTADQVIYQTEKSLQNLNGQAPSALREQVESKISALKEAMNGEDSARIKQLTAEVQQAAMAIGEAAYQTDDTGTNGTAPEAEEEDFVEGEFETA